MFVIVNLKKICRWCREEKHDDIHVIKLEELNYLKIREPSALDMHQEMQAESGWSKCLINYANSSSLDFYIQENSLNFEFQLFQNPHIKIRGVWPCYSAETNCDCRRRPVHLSSDVKFDEQKNIITT